MASHLVGSRRLSDLGISVDTLAAEFESCHRAIENKTIEAAVSGEDGCVESAVEQVGLQDNEIVTENCSTHDVSSSIPSQDGTVEQVGHSSPASSKIWIGRGKNRKVGGLTTLQLPTPGETFELAEDAQNRVAAFALYQLFPDLPVHLMMTYPYASLVLQWLEGDLSGDVKNTEVDRRVGFVDSLLNADASDAFVSKDLSDTSRQNDSQIFYAQEDKNSREAGVDKFAESMFLFYYTSFVVHAYNVYMCGPLRGKSKSALILTLFQLFCENNVKIIGMINFK
ncbi:hypothetical protein R6Q57_010158 [Mikania cordata]